MGADDRTARRECRDSRARAEMRVTRPEPGRVHVVLAGCWALGAPRPDLGPLAEALEDGAGVRSVSFDAAAVSAWDTSLLTFLREVARRCRAAGVEMASDGLPEGVRRLLRLAAAVPAIPRAPGAEPGFAARLGLSTLELARRGHGTVSFVGELAVSCGRLLRGRAQFRVRDLVRVIHDCGPAALPIVTLIAFLMGVILAFVGAVQLRLFGAEIYVADLVGIGIIRALGAIMTGVVMAGRSGAAFAAQLGTMQVNDEIDALRTMGISPVDFLALPRLLGLTLVLPLLCVYANVVGVLGGMFVSVTMLDVNAMLYYQETVLAVGLDDWGIGVVMSFVFGILVALCGCYRGMTCEHSSAAVGYAATAAVVNSIVGIVVATAVITGLCDVLGI